MDRLRGQSHHPISPMVNRTDTEAADPKDCQFE